MTVWSECNSHRTEEARRGARSTHARQHTQRTRAYRVHTLTHVRRHTRTDTRPCAHLAHIHTHARASTRTHASQHTLAHSTHAHKHIHTRARTFRTSALAVLAPIGRTHTCTHGTHARTRARARSNRSNNEREERTQKSNRSLLEKKFEQHGIQWTNPADQVLQCKMQHATWSHQRRRRTILHSTACSAHPREQVGSPSLSDTLRAASNAARPFGNSNARMCRRCCGPISVGFVLRCSTAYRSRSVFDAQCASVVDLYALFDCSR